MDLKEAIETVGGLVDDGWFDGEEGQALAALLEHARRALDAPKGEAAEPAFTEAEAAEMNLQKAADIVAQIGRVRRVLTELKSAFARSELDGGAKAALEHPLHAQAQERLRVLHDQLMMVI